MHACHAIFHGLAFNSSYPSICLLITLTRVQSVSFGTLIGPQLSTNQQLVTNTLLLRLLGACEQEESS